VNTPAPAPPHVWPEPGTYAENASNRDLWDANWPCKCGDLPDEHHDGFVVRYCLACEHCDDYQPARDRACEACGGSGAWGDHEHCQTCTGDGWQ
jgi:hypothetical protein